MAPSCSNMIGGGAIGGPTSNGMSLKFICDDRLPNTIANIVYIVNHQWLIGGWDIGLSSSQVY